MKKYEDSNDDASPHMLQKENAAGVSEPVSKPRLLPSDLPDHPQSTFYLTRNGRRSSIRLETETWQALNEIATRENLEMNELIEKVAAHNPPNIPHATALRIFALSYFRALADN